MPAQSTYFTGTARPDRRESALRLLILGGSGFIGGATAAAALEKLLPKLDRHFARVAGLAKQP